MRVVRHSSELGWWESIFQDPHPAVRACVNGQYQAWTESTPQPLRRREVPSAIVPVILNLGSPFALVDRERDGQIVRRYSFIAGLHTSYALVEGTGPSRCIQMNLTPIGALLVLGLPLSEMTNRVVELEDLLGSEGRRLMDRLHDAAGWAECFALLDCFLAARIERARPMSQCVSWVWQLLVESDGRIAIGELAADIGYSRKHMTAQVREQLGLPPKMLGRILRFSRAIQAAEANQEVRWAAVAQDCGYFDQAHFIRDFVAFSGLTPSEYSRSRIPDGGLIA
jgi:AraC-like DNA-binding protein